MIENGTDGSKATIQVIGDENEIFGNRINTTQTNSIGIYLDSGATGNVIGHNHITATSRLSDSGTNTIIKGFEDTATTTDATVTTAHAYTLADNTAILFQAKVLAIEDDASDRNLYHIEGLFYRDGAGAVQQGATTSITTIESEINCDCVFDVNGNDARLRITGIAAENWNWKWEINITPIS